MPSLWNFPLPADYHQEPQLLKKHIAAFDYSHLHHRVDFCRPYSVLVRPGRQTQPLYPRPVRVHGSWYGHVSLNLVYSILLVFQQKPNQLY